MLYLVTEYVPNGEMFGKCLVNVEFDPLRCWRAAKSNRTRAAARSR